MFKNREEAGRKLAGVLLPFKNENPLVLAIPRGGVQVGYHVARRLRCEFSIVICRKLGFPQNPEAAFGAIAEDKSLYLNSRYRRTLDKDTIEKVMKKETEEIKRRIQLYRKGESLPEIKGRTIILVDDGIATGSTLLSAIELCKKKDAGRIVVAAPVSGSQMKEKLQDIVDEVVILETPYNFYGVSQIYENFSSVEDADIIKFMEDAKDIASTNNHQNYEYSHS